MSIQLRKNVSLITRNCLRLPAEAEYFVEIHNHQQLLEALSVARQQGLQVKVLGAGSNLVLPEKIPGLTLHIAMDNLEIESHGADSKIHGQAGKNWHQLVNYSVNRGFYGLENLALIPGTLGATPIQNIGAYGIEISQVFESLSAVSIDTGETEIFNNKDCQFDYRDSVFKHREKDAWVIMEITLKLHQNKHQITTDYPALQRRLEQYHPSQPNPQQVMQAVCEERISKLPDPDKIPNVGSFFKNPILGKVQAEQFRQQNPNAPCYQHGQDQLKVPAAWLIEQAGWKGRNLGPVAMYQHQALVLVNENRGNRNQVQQLATQVQISVKEKFSIALEYEPLWW